MVQFSLSPSSYFSRPWSLPLTLLSALPSFHWQTALISSLSLGSQPSPALSLYACLCLFVSVTVCMSLSLPCTLSVSASLQSLSCRLIFHILTNLILLPLPLSPCLLAFSVSSLRSVL